ncbi:MAG: OmpA family protein, partial [Proteobacteria bacterium]|nr:OmpA family protein [Pseudomonadota bacterium]
ALFLSIALPAMAEQVVVRKVNNVFYVADTSDSMKESYSETGMDKLDLAKDLMKRIAHRMPELGYKTAVYQFADFKEFQKLDDYLMATHDRAVDDVDISDAKGSVMHRSMRSTWDDDTPIGDGLFELAWPISEGKGPSAVILFTDGDYDTGQRPLSMARHLYSQFDVCIHVVSFAQTEAEHRVVEDLAEVNPCSFVRLAETLLTDPIALENFVKDVGWGLRTVHKFPPAGPQEPEKQFKTVDMELNIEFDFDKYNIRPQYYSELDDLAEVLKKNPDTRVLIVGHTDNRGGYEYNVTLSLNRSNAMKAYLVKNKGIDAGRIDTEGYSYSKPKASNDTDEGRQRNRHALARITGWYEVEEVK